MIIFFGMPNPQAISCTNSAALDAGDSLNLDPLSQFVDGDKGAGVTTQGYLEGSNQIQLPVGKRLGWRYSPYGLCWDVLLFGEEQTSSTLFYQVQI